MDEADRAQTQIDQHLEAALAAARGIQPPDIESAQVCVECACEIDARRRLAVKGCQLCRECAERFESMRSRGLR